MSSDREEAADDEVCANCGKAAVDNIKLNMCTACRLVKYCSVECQKDHRPQHKRACKQRMAKIRDDKLFQQPDENYLGECPICCLPQPIDLRKSKISSCCCKRICSGCAYANSLREREQGLERKCLYCREPLPNTEEEGVQNLMKRVKANDPVAMRQMGCICDEEGDYGGAFEYWTKAAALGDMMAHYNLSLMYSEGKGVEKDNKKKVYHLEEAAIGGHPDARFNLGCIKGNNERSVKHFIIAAKLGDDDALEAVKMGFSHGFVSKEEYAGALRGHQAAVDATKSEQRDEAYAFFKQRGML